MLYLKWEEIRMVSREASWSPRLSLGWQKLGVAVLSQSASLNFTDAESVFWHCSENWAWNSCGQLQRDWWINWNAMLIICNWWRLLPVPAHRAFISHVDFHNSSQLASPLPLLSCFSPFSTGRPEWSLRSMDWILFLSVFKSFCFCHYQNKVQTLRSLAFVVWALPPLLTSSQPPIFSSPFSFIHTSVLSDLDSHVFQALCVSGSSADDVPSQPFAGLLHVSNVNLNISSMQRDFLTLPTQIKSF